MPAAHASNVAALRPMGRVLPPSYDDDGARVELNPAIEGGCGRHCRREIPCPQILRGASRPGWVVWPASAAARSNGASIGGSRPGGWYLGGSGGFRLAVSPSARLLCGCLCQRRPRRPVFAFGDQSRSVFVQIQTPPLRLRPGEAPEQGAASACGSGGIVAAVW
jgi:hypothetical protein